MFAKGLGHTLTNDLHMVIFCTIQIRSLDSQCRFIFVFVSHIQVNLGTQNPPYYPL